MSCLIAGIVRLWVVVHFSHGGPVFLLFFPLFRNDHLSHFQNVNKKSLSIKFIHIVCVRNYQFFSMDLSSICGYVDTHSDCRLE